MKIGRPRSAFANSSMEWNTSSGRSSSWSHFQKTIILCVSSSQFITFFYKGITSTDTRSSSKNPNNPDGLSKENEFESNQHQERYGTDMIFGAVNNDAEHPYELTSNRWNIHLKTSQFHFRRSSSSRRLAWKSPVSSIVSGSLESESPSTDIYWSNGSVVRPPTMSIANEVKTSLKISCPWKVKTRWSTNNESQLFLPSISPASIKRFWQ